MGLLVSLVLVGCGSSARGYAEARRACDLAEGESVATPWNSHAGELRPLETPCVTRLAEDFGLVWSEFDAEPARIVEPTQAWEAVVAGLFVMVAADLGTVEELLGSTDAPHWLVQEMQSIVDDTGLAGDSPAGEALYSFVAHRVHSIGRDVDATGTAHYDGSRRRIEVTDWYREVNEDEGLTITNGPMYPIEALATIVHEASHYDGVDHVDCEFGEEFCDSDAEGSYGAELFLRHQWIAELDYAGTGEDWWSCLDARFTACSLILDTAGFAPCETEHCER